MKKMTKYLNFSIIIVITFVLLMATLEESKVTGSCAAVGIAIEGKVSGNSVYVRKTASRTGEKLFYKEEAVKLRKNVSVLIKGQKTANAETWYRIAFQYDKKSLIGYMLSDYVKLTLKEPVKAKIAATAPVKLAMVPGEGNFVKVDRQTITLQKGKAVQILKESSVGGKKWFYISSTYRVQSRTKSVKGYVQAKLLSFTPYEISTSNTPAVSVKPSASPVKTKKPVVSPSPVATKKPVASPTPKPSKSKAPAASLAPSPEQSMKGKTGTVTASALNVRTGAGTSYGVLVWNSKKVQIVQGTRVLILDSETANSSVWYKVSFSYQDSNLVGFVSGNYIQTGQMPEASTSPVPTRKPSQPSTSAEPPAALTDEQFEAALTEQQFPEDYKDGLRVLHQKYPLWQFKSYHTGINWATAVKNENVVGKNLISNAKASGWKSYENKAYNWNTDTCTPFDGSSWVTASKEAIEYYMDPRNFLTTDGIYQFEYLAYESEYQREQGVESILKNTVLSNKSYTYKENEKEVTKTYGKTFINAAEYSGVNPFHLATRVKQEVVTSSGLSSSATGKLSPYTGYYNFYNIGAYHSTEAYGAVKNGLNFAKNGGSMSSANKTACLIPWNNQYRAIVGGAKYIGTNYINRGQNTVYLQKFNVSGNSTYNHQYMANVEAAKSEAQKTFTAYKDFTDIPVVFYIPVYNNMPAGKAPVPGNKSNPNNWLKLLSVTDANDNTECVMTPAFSISNAESTTYTIMVDSDTSSVKINAKSVSSLASVTGDGTKELKEGTNTFKIKVTAQNGSVRTYIVYVIKA